MTRAPVETERVQENPMERQEEGSTGPETGKQSKKGPQIKQGYRIQILVN